MNKKIMIGTIFATLMLTVPMTSIIGASDITEDCNCQVLNRYNNVRFERLLVRLENSLRMLLLVSGDNPEIAYKYQEIIDVINSDGLNEIFCEILKRIGILIEELGKIFPEGTIIYPILVLMMFPIIILWNEYCD